MPFMSGLKVVQKLRAYIETLNEAKMRVCEPVFIFVSAHASNPNLREMWRRDKIFHVYEKPLSHSA